MEVRLEKSAYHQFKKQKRFQARHELIAFLRIQFRRFFFVNSLCSINDRELNIVRVFQIGSSFVRKDYLKVQSSKIDLAEISSIR